MPKWLNEWVELSTQNVVDSFECDCEPQSRPHEQMQRGALLNANTQEFYLRARIVDESDETRLPTS
jgi:hypothetical protein